jgi:hypothetical protein
LASTSGLFSGECNLTVRKSKTRNQKPKVEEGQIDQNKKEIRAINDFQNTTTIISVIGQNDIS